MSARSPATSTSSVLGGLTPRAFLGRHWQKAPLLVRRAFPAFRDPLTPSRVLALAGRADVESRLVIERGGARPWQLVPGPLAARARRRLPASHWTVLVQGVDGLVPAVADLVEAFDFLPRWRFDDVMVSLAAPQGSVGPHVDSYDVFLVQGRGRRRWAVATRFPESYRPGLDLRVLRGFRAEREWVLEPGDMLYVPPGVAHHGVALEECLTYSIGLRAPSHFDLVSGFLQRVVNAVDRTRLYADPDLEPARAPGEIAPSSMARLRAIVERACAAVRGPDLVRFVGERLTEPKAGPSGPRPGLPPTVVARRLLSGASLVRRPGARLAYARVRGGKVELFADGRAWTVERSLAACAPILTARRVVPGARLRPWLRRPGLAALLAQLVAARVFDVAAGTPPRAAARGGTRSRRGAGSRSPRARRPSGGVARAARRGA